MLYPYYVVDPDGQTMMTVRTYCVLVCTCVLGLSKPPIKQGKGLVTFS